MGSASKCFNPRQSKNFEGTKTDTNMNLNQKLSILFRLNYSKQNNQGFVPIWTRITVDGKRSEFSTSHQVLPKQWNVKKEEVISSDPEADVINDHLLQIRIEIKKHFNILLTTKDRVTAEEVRNSYKGIKAVVIKRTFLEVFKQFNQQLLERKEIEDLSEGRYKRFLINFGKCQGFIQYKFKKSDIYLEEVQLSFVVEFEHYLRTVEKIGHNTAMKYAKDLKQVTRYAVMLGYLSSNPFENFKCTYKKVKRHFLDQDELNTLYSKSISIPRLAEVRDCYIFSCYTGYAYSDAEALTPNDVAVGIDGNLWIIRDRKKTDTTENVPLLPIAKEIIQRYRNHPHCKANNKLLPVNSNQRYNAYLKEIADLCGIEKKLTTHTARHTFATTVLLLNDVPMETAMELLGHTDIRTTQIYGKIVQKKISNDMISLQKKLSLVPAIVDNKNEKVMGNL